MLRNCFLRKRLSQHVYFGNNWLQILNLENFCFNTYMCELKNTLNANSLQYASWKDFGQQKYTLMMYGCISLQINMFIANDVINTAKQN